MRETSCNNSSSSNVNKLHQKTETIFHLFSAKLNKKYPPNPAITVRVRRVWDAKGYENCTGCSLAQNRTIATYTYTHTHAHRTAPRTATELGWNESAIATGGLSTVRLHDPSTSSGAQRWAMDHSVSVLPLYRGGFVCVGGGGLGFARLWCVFFFSFFEFCLCASFYGPYFIKRSVCFRHNSFFFSLCPLFCRCFLCASVSLILTFAGNGRGWKKGR